MNLQDLGITNEDLVNRLVERLAEGLLDNDETFADRVHRSVQERIKEQTEWIAHGIAKEEIERQVKAVIDAPWQESTSWGEKRGEPKTFRELVNEKIAATLIRRVDSNGRLLEYGEGQKLIDFLIRSQVEATVKDEIKTAVTAAATAARNEVLGKVNEAVLAAVKNVIGLK